MMPVAWCLSFHAGYGCRRSGACCRAGWAIPFDPAEAARVETLHLTGVRGLVRPGREDGSVFADISADGTCGFFRPADRLCAIHRAGGHGALPITCQMFPRLVLQDPRGAFVSLSHFCPTAAALLFADDRPATIVEAPVSLVGNIALEGLDARETWPPLLRRGVLMDVESYAVWERHAIAILTGDGVSPWQALGRIEAATSTLLDWKPEGGASTLSQRVEEAFAEVPGVSGLRPDGRLWSVVRSAVPEGVERPNLPVGWIAQVTPSLAALEEHASAACRWLAARLFGTWIAYQGTGLRTILDYLRAALDVLVVEMARGARDAILDQRAAMEAIRRSDHLLIHRAGSERLVTLLS
jgi:Fe-S-cluster containining protein